MSTENTSPENAPAQDSPAAPAPAPAEKPKKKQRSPIERVIVWGVILGGLGVVCVEARAKYGYDMTREHLIAAAKQDDPGQSEEEIPEEGGGPPRVPALSDEGPEEDEATVDENGEPGQKVHDAGNMLVNAPAPATLDELRTAPFKKYAALSAILAARAGQAEKRGLVYTRNLHWWSVRDLYSPRPAYQITLTLGGPEDDADVVSFETAGLDPLPQPKPKEIDPTLPPDPIGAGGAGFGGGRRRNREGGRSGRPQRPGGADEDKADEDKADEDKADDTKADDTKADDTKADDTKADDTKADDTKADDTKADDTKADDTKADDTKADDTKADDTKADDTKGDDTKGDDAAGSEKESGGDDSGN